VTVDENRITLQIWDTAGQERFRAMAPLYYRKAKAAVVVFDVTDDRTFRKAKGWLDELKKHVASNVVLCVCANKVDMLEEYGGKMPMGAVPDEELKEYMLEENAELFYTSAKNNIGVEGLFENIARKLLKLYQKEREMELHRQRELQSSGGGNGSDVNNAKRNSTDQNFSKRIKITDPKASSRKSEGCC
jgi:small GTP-binding protein